MTRAIDSYGVSAGDHPHRKLPEGWVGHGIVGLRLVVPLSSTANIWAGPTLIRPLPLAPIAMSVKSTSAADFAGATDGAIAVAVTYIDDQNDWRWSDLIFLNGVTPVPITTKPTYPKFTEPGTFLPQPFNGGSVTASVLRVQSVSVLAAAGATQAAPFAANTGSIDVVDTATATTVFDRIAPEQGVSHTAAFRVPRGFEGLLSVWVAGIERGAAKVYFDAALAGGTAWARVPFSSIDSATAIYHPDPAAVPVPPLTDFVATAITGTNNVDVESAVQLRLRPTA